jgi:hypothetical protein
MSKLEALIYVSSAVGTLSDEDIEHLLTQARDRNIEHNITGLLMFIGGNFIQYIEGPSSELDLIYKIIMDDPMHAGIIKLMHAPIENREFSNWAMAYCTKNREALVGDSNDQEILNGKLGELSYKKTPARILLSNFWRKNSS